MYFQASFFSQSPITIILLVKVLFQEEIMNIILVCNLQKSSLILYLDRSNPNSSSLQEGLLYPVLPPQSGPSAFTPSPPGSTHFTSILWSHPLSLTEFISSSQTSSLTINSFRYLTNTLLVLKLLCHCFIYLAHCLTLYKLK